MLLIKDLAFDIFIPTLFKKAKGILLLPPFVCPSIFFVPPPGALGRDQNVKYNLISITKSISKIFIPNFVCVLTNERYKTYQTGIFCRLGHALGVGLGGA